MATVTIMLMKKEHERNMNNLLPASTLLLV